MINSYVSTATIRQRGQLTIPDEIRSRIPWLENGSVIQIISTDTQEVRITPYSDNRKPDWDKIWRLISLTRSFKSKSKAKIKSLSEFIIEDRERH